MSGVIVPTVGRQVWYWMPGAKYGVDQPEAATVCYVHSERMVNLQVLTHRGSACGATSVPLAQADGDPPYEKGATVVMPFCEWMPYQNGQAAKTEQLERQVEQGGAS